MTMKSIISRLSRHTTIFFFPLLLLFRWEKKGIVFGLFSALLLVGCFQKFYQTGTLKEVNAETIEKLKKADKYFILHYTDSVYEMRNLAVTGNQLVGRRSVLPKAHSGQLAPAEGGGHNVKARNMDAVLSEVHLYVNKAAAGTTGNEVMVDLPDIYRLDAYEFDEKSTKSSTVMSIIGLTVAGLLAVGIIVASNSYGSDTGSNSQDSVNCGCPQVYVERMGNFDFQNGIFSGSVYANLERLDYLPLQGVQPIGQEVRLKLAGHEHEQQYINSAKLMGVVHKGSERVLADRNGQHYAINDTEPPATARSGSQQDLRSQLAEADGQAYTFNSYSVQEDFSKVYLTFDNKDHRTTAKLMVRARNTGWAALLNKEYALLFGEEYARYREYVEKKKSDLTSYLVNQGLPLKVYVERNGKWEFADYFALNGTENYREMVMQIRVPEEATIHLKLESVFRFWELDQAVLDFSNSPELHTFTVDPVQAHHSALGDQLGKLYSDDTQYSLLSQDESIDLVFRVPEPYAGARVSYFLKAGGYYHDQNSYPVKANMAKLKEFEKPGAFDHFSREKYSELVQMQTLLRGGGYGNR